jgi:hypothetical protein
MSMTKSWSLPNAGEKQSLDGALIDDRISTLPYFLSGHVDSTIGSLSIEGLTIDRSVSAPPKQDSELSSTRYSWQNNDSLHLLTDSAGWVNPLRPRGIQNMTGALYETPLSYPERSMNQ